MFVVTLLACLLSATPVAVAQSFTIATNGKPQCIIQTTPAYQQMAKELQHWLKQVTGGEVPIRQEASAGKAIVLATADEYPQEARQYRVEELGAEGYVIVSSNNRLLLLANTELGLQHAVYRLLDTIGCRWLAPNPAWTIIPRKPTLRVSLNLREKPAFDDRVIWYTWGVRSSKLAEEYRDWFKRNRQGGSFKAHTGHAYESYIPHREFEQHPEWFALVDGKRQPAQLCVSNPEVQQRVIEGVLEAFRKDPKRLMVSVEPNDGGGHCECDNCRALGTVSDRVFTLANVVAKAVRARYPDKWVGLLSYAFHSEPPNIRIEPGVYVQVVNGFNYTPLSFEERLERIRRQGAAVGIYDYFAVFEWDWSLPGASKASRVYELAKDIKMYHRIGGTTISAQAGCDWVPYGLGYWVAARLMWQPKLDPRALVAEFCRLAYGRAERPMRRLHERWARGERFSARGLRLALDDLEEAYRLETSPEVRARLDQVALYLHWLRLWLDYDRLSCLTEFGKLVNPPDEVLAKAREWVVYSRRVLDTGVVHITPFLFSGWGQYRLDALTKIEGFDWKQVEAWKEERTDIPTAEEIAQIFADDVRHLRALVPEAVEIVGKQYTGRLVPIAEARPELVRAWGDVARSALFVETGWHYFVGEEGERIRARYTPFDAGHTVDCRWQLQRADGRAVSEGHLQLPKGEGGQVELRLPEAGVYRFRPGTDYWKAAQVELGRRPMSVWAGYSGPVLNEPLRLWMPRPDQPLYFYVPKGTRHFVIGIVSGGWPHTELVLRLPDGTELKRERLLAGDQISVIVDKDIEEYQSISEIGRQTIVPAQQLTVRVPKGADGRIWSLSLNSLRCAVELYDIPPFVARHPSELLVPEDALKGR